MSALDAGEAVKTEPFTRDRLTWLGYLLIGSYCFILSAMGPLMPFLRSELRINYTVAAYHFSAWALGSLIAGTLGDRVLTGLGRRKTVWISVGVICLSTAAFVSARAAWLTVLSSFLCGVSASILGQTVNIINADRFGGQRALAMTESNIVASIFAASAPAAVSLCVRQGFGWRIALIFPIILFLALFVLGRTTPVPERVRPEAKITRGGALPWAYWGYWTVMLLMVACEWSLIFWSAEFLQQVGKLSKTDASQAVSVFLLAMLSGRILGRRLARTLSTATLLRVACPFALTGFAIFWLGRTAVWNLSGLFLAGIGIANFYPLTLASAIAVVPERSTVATARLSIGTGSAILCAPLLLGMIADKMGIFVAYGVVGVLLCLAALLVFGASAAASRFDRAGAGVG